MILVRFLLTLCAALLIHAGAMAQLPERMEPKAEAVSDTAPLPTPLEESYSARAGVELRLFGHGLFANGEGQTILPTGMVGGDYVLGVGDALTVALRGQRSVTAGYRIGRDGRLLVEGLRPVQAAGRTLGEVRAEMERQVAASLLDTRIFLSLSAVRQVGVLAIGEVARPGRQTISALSSVLDVLQAAGGVTRQGSLRTIRLVRRGETIPIDLYELLRSGTSDADMAIRDGDRILAPPVGPTIAVAGSVNQPGIYELPPPAFQIGVEHALQLAGGTVAPRPMRRLRLGFGPDGVELAEEIEAGSGAMLSDGDILIVSPTTDRRSRAVAVEGHVVAPGPYALDTVRTVGGLIEAAAGLRPEPYLAFAALESTDTLTRERHWRPLDLGEILDGRDVALHEGDRLVVLSAEDVGYMTSADVLDILTGAGADPESLADCPGLVALDRLLSGRSMGRWADHPFRAAARTLAPSGVPCPDILKAQPDLLPLAFDHAILRWQGADRPGFYPRADRLPATSDATTSATGIAAEPPYAVILEGHVWLPGLRPLTPGTTLRSLIDAEALKPGAYPLLGVIVRPGVGGLGRTFLPFSPYRAAAGLEDRALTRGDRIILFALDEIVALQTEDEDGGGRESPPKNDVRPLAGRDLASFVRRQAVSLVGEVGRPLSYPVAARTTLEALIDAADGLTRMADLTEVEITSPTERGAARRVVDLTVTPTTTISVRPGDSIRINPLDDPLTPAGIVIAGEVLRPGVYDLMRGETLSDLIARAGGLTVEAYPAGAIFSRERARLREERRFRSDADNLDRQLAVQLASEDPPNDAEIALARELSQQLRTVEPVGRVVVEADPEVLALSPELDVVLEPGDRLFVPKRPLSVIVAGEVLAPATLQFRTGKDARDYIREAGGFGHYADDDRVHVIYPDGRAAPIAASYWEHTPVLIPPGSTIVVPRDPEPFDFLAFADSITGILGQIALTAASVTVLQSD
ncbi:SLBB domain-containing protein [Inquilinus sp. CAU 1745]|uniref:SLBB domain-containing protein n=1 Tax=Inquilinus sp. CAU 1745 TaxID=3140369 RepID=UPI00325AA745